MSQPCSAPVPSYSSSARAVAVCTGSNYYGEASPPPFTDFVQHSCGPNTVCGVRRGGILACWGYDSWADLNGVRGVLQVSVQNNHM